MYDQIDKIKSLKKITDKNSYNIKIAANGGINSEISDLIIGAGVQTLVTGSYLNRYNL